MNARRLVSCVVAVCFTSAALFAVPICVQDCKEVIGQMTDEGCEKFDMLICIPDIWVDAGDPKDCNLKPPKTMVDECVACLPTCGIPPGVVPDQAEAMGFAGCLEMKRPYPVFKCEARGGGGPGDDSI